MSPIAQVLFELHDLRACAQFSGQRSLFESLTQSLDVLREELDGRGTRRRLVQRDHHPEHQRSFSAGYRRPELSGDRDRERVFWRKTRLRDDSDRLRRFFRSKYEKQKSSDEDQESHKQSQR